MRLPFAILAVQRPLTCPFDVSGVNEKNEGTHMHAYRASPMASEAALSTHYLGKVLPGSCLEIPRTIVEHMGLNNGDEVVVALHKVTAAGVSLPAEAQTLIQELVGIPSSLQETVEALTAIATEMMPHQQQRRLSRLLWKNQDGVITAKEEAELDTLVAAGQQATLRKAKALLALKHLGIDILPALETRVGSTKG